MNERMMMWNVVCLRLKYLDHRNHAFIITSQCPRSLWGQLYEYCKASVDAKDILGIHSGVRGCNELTTASLKKLRFLTNARMTFIYEDDETPMEIMETARADVTRLPLA